MPESTHIPEITQVEFVGKDGKKRTVPKIQYRRNEQAKAAAEEHRLGHMAHQAVTQDPSVLHIFDKKQLVVVAPYYTARTIAATRIRSDKRTHKVLTGTDILHHYLTKEGKENEVMRGGFSQFHQLYLFFGYIEAPNSYLPSLLVQLVGQRHHEDLHVWLFLPREPAALAGQWTEAMHNLSHLDRFKFETLTDQSETPAGPESTMPVKKVSPDTGPPKKDMANDPKLKPRDGRRRSK